MTDSTITGFPQYADWLQELSKSASHPFARDSYDSINYCFSLDHKLPDNYGWRLSDIEAIKVQTQKSKSFAELNSIYWVDFARNCEAYSVMTYWRGVELIKPTIRTLNIKEVIAAAVLARSLLELSATFISNANIIHKNISDLEFPSNPPVVSSELEAFILRCIWGTRLGEPEPHLKQINILTTIQKLSKNPDVSDLLPIYEYLCEVAHPNVIGNAKYWSHIDHTYSDGSQRLIISRHADVDSYRETIENILWSIGWGSICLRNAFEMISQSIQILLQKLK